MPCDCAEGTKVQLVNSYAAGLKEEINLHCNEMGRFLNSVTRKHKCNKLGNI